MLRRLFADNYRCFVNFEFQPARMNLLIGDNGSGKSTVFGVLWALQRLLRGRERVQDIFLATDLTAWETQRDLQRFELDITGPDGDYRYALEIEHHRSHETARIRSEELSCAGRSLYRQRGTTVEIFADDGTRESEFSVATDESFLALLEPGPGNQRTAWFKRYIDQIAIHRLNVRLVRSESVREAAQLSNEGDNFASFFRSVLQEHADAVPEITQALRRVLPGYKGMRLVGERRRELLVDFFSSGEAARGPGASYPISFYELSDGQIVLIILYTLLYTVCRQGRLLCLDEPDNYVSLREIQPWLAALRDELPEARGEQSGGQAMIISHHPEVIDYLAADSAWEFQRSAGPARVRALVVPRERGLSASQWLLERLGEP